jgi:hypothetical protein
MIIKKLIPFFVLIFLFEKISGQSFQEQMKAIDEGFNKRKSLLIEELQKYTKPDIDRVKALEKLLRESDGMFQKHFKEIMPYANECIQLSKKTDYKLGLSTSYLIYHLFKKTSRERKVSMSYADSCITVSENSNGALIKQNLNIAYLGQARYYQQSEDFYLALKYYFKMLENNEHLTPTTRNSAYYNIGLIYFNQKNYEKSEYYIKSNINLKSKSLTDKIIIYDYNLLASTYIAQKKFESADVYIDKIKAFELDDKDFDFQSYCNLKANYFEAKAKYDSSYFYRIKQYGIVLEDKFSGAEIPILKQLGNLAIKLNKFEDAKIYADKCLVSAANSKELKFNANFILSQYYYHKNDISKAYSYLVESGIYRDSLFLEATYNQNNALANIYEITKLENTNIATKAELIKKEDSFKLQKIMDDASFTKQLLLNNQQEQSLLLQNNQLLLSREKLNTLNKDKELQHLAFLKTQADLQTEQLQNSEKEKELTLVQKETILKSTQVKSLSQENELNKLKQRQLLIYGIAGLTTLLFAGLYLFNRNRAKQAQLKVELEKKEAEFQRSLADVSMSALRSQMNPHFIFNCLNSIKLYTTQNDTVAASNYLTKFSKLIRMALENSRSETVTLDAELESLELYIQMEAMRFKEKLKYSIAIDKNVDSSFIEIPPMLLQPYVENAIWHGLMHREDGGRIDISVRVVPNEHTLAITIKDNGVGREKAAQLKSKTATAHKSFGTKVTGERLNLINQIYKTGASVTIEDLTSNGEVTGTLVTIKIPFE